MTAANPNQETPPMRQIINKKIYDTTTAEHIHDTSNTSSFRDFKYERSALYRTPHGAWFVAGYGGASSRFARTLSDGCRTEGEGIIVLTPEGALEELERDNATEEIERHLSALVTEA